MTRANAIGTLFFWLMLALGAAGLAPALILPAWLEHQQARAALAAQQAQVADLEQHLRAIEKQIDHLNTDPAYLLRLAEQDFGHLRVPNVETIRVAPGTTSEEPPAPEQSPAPLTDISVLELDRYVDEFVRRYPHAYLFVDPQARPILMLLSGALIFTAIVLLGRSSVKHGQITADDR